MKPKTSAELAAEIPFQIRQDLERGDKILFYTQGKFGMPKFLVILYLVIGLYCTIGIGTIAAFNYQDLPLWGDLLLVLFFGFGLVLLHGGIRSFKKPLFAIGETHLFTIIDDQIEKKTWRSFLADFVVSGKTGNFTISLKHDPGFSSSVFRDYLVGVNISLSQIGMIADRLLMQGEKSDNILSASSSPLIPTELQSVVDGSTLDFVVSANKSYPSIEIYFFVFIGILMSSFSGIILIALFSIIHQKPLVLSIVIVCFILPFLAFSLTILTWGIKEFFNSKISIYSTILGIYFHKPGSIRIVGWSEMFSAAVKKPLFGTSYILLRGSYENNAGRLQGIHHDYLYLYLKPNDLHVLEKIKQRIEENKHKKTYVVSDQVLAV